MTSQQRNVLLILTACVLASGIYGIFSGRFTLPAKKTQTSITSETLPTTVVSDDTSGSTYSNLLNTFNSLSTFTKLDNDEKVSTQEAQKYENMIKKDNVLCEYDQDDSTVSISLHDPEFLMIITSKDTQEVQNVLFNGETGYLWNVEKDGAAQAYTIQKENLQFFMSFANNEHVFKDDIYKTVVSILKVPLGSCGRLEKAGGNFVAPSNIEFEDVTLQSLF